MKPSVLRQKVVVLALPGLAGRPRSLAVRIIQRAHSAILPNFANQFAYIGQPAASQVGSGLYDIGCHTGRPLVHTGERRLAQS